MAPNNAVIRVLLADDHHLVRAGIKAILSGEPEIEVVGECSDARTVADQARQSAPHVVLMNLNLPGLNGLEVIAVLRQEMPEARVLAFTIYREPYDVTQIVRAGAHGYLSTVASAAELIDAVRRVGRGIAHFSSEAAISFLSAHVGKMARNGGERVRALSKRELEVLKLIAEGKGNKQIATRLGVSTRTVETHREHIMRKLDIHSVAGITRYAIAQGLIPVE